MIQGMPKIAPDVDMRFPRAMAKVILQECVGQNDRQTCGTSTDITDAHWIICMDKQTHVITNKDACGSMFTNDRKSTCIDVCTESIDVDGSTCP